MIVPDELRTELAAFIAPTAKAEAGGTGPSDAHAATGDSLWERPVALASYTLPPFPVHVFPAGPRTFIQAEATATQTPPDLAGQMYLACIAACCAKKVAVQIKPGYSEPINIYTATAMAPGTRKTRVVSDLIAPIEEYEEEDARRLETEIAEQRTRYKILEATLQKAEADAVKAAPEHRASRTTEATAIARELAAFRLPRVARIVADDVTPEKIAGLLAEHDGRMAILTAEGGDILDLAGGRYGNGPNFGVFLRGHAGDTLRVDRMGRPPEYVKQPALTMGLAVQPDVWAGLSGKHGFRGRGLLGRYVYALPDSLLGRRDTNPAPVPTALKEAHRRRLRALLALPFAEDEQGQPAAHLLLLSAAARVQFAAFEAWIEPQLAPDGALGMMTDWGGKLVGAVARIAGLLHMGTHADHATPWSLPISAETVDSAIALGRYYIPHAQAAYALMGSDPVVEDARRVLAWIERKGKESFSQRDALRDLEGHFKTVEALKPALAMLVERSYIREQPAEPKQGAGRPRSPQYSVNPCVHSVDAPDTGHCVDCVDIVGTVASSEMQVPDDDQETLRI